MDCFESGRTLAFLFLASNTYAESGRTLAFLFLASNTYAYETDIIIIILRFSIPNLTTKYSYIIRETLMGLKLIWSN